MSKSRKVHLEVVKWVFRHLKGMSSTSLIYKGKEKASKVIGFVDSNFVRHLDKRSLTGYLFILGGGFSELECNSLQDYGFVIHGG